MTTIFATQEPDEHVMLWWSSEPQWYDGPRMWRPTSGYAKDFQRVCVAAFRLIFGCESVPTAEEAWQFEAVFAMEAGSTKCGYGWRRVKVHTPPGPEKEKACCEELKKENARLFMSCEAMNVEIGRLRRELEEAKAGEAFVYVVYRTDMDERDPAVMVCSSPAAARRSMAALYPGAKYEVTQMEVLDTEARPEKLKKTQQAEAEVMKLREENKTLAHRLRCANALASEYNQTASTWAARAAAFEKALHEIHLLTSVESVPREVAAREAGRTAFAALRVAEQESEQPKPSRPDTGDAARPGAPGQILRPCEISAQEALHAEQIKQDERLTELEEAVHELVKRVDYHLQWGKENDKRLDTLEHAKVSAEQCIAGLSVDLRGTQDYISKLEKRAPLGGPVRTWTAAEIEKAYYGTEWGCWNEFKSSLEALPEAKP